MKIIINVLNLATAGGLAVGLNFIDALKKYHLKNGDEYIAIVPQNSAYVKYAAKHLKVIEVDAGGLVKRLWCDYISLPRLIQSYQPDVIFSLGNYPVRYSHCQQAVLIMWPYAIYPKNHIGWQRLNWKNSLRNSLRLLEFKRRIKYVDIFFPQTAVSESLLKDRYNNSFKTRVVPMGYTELSDKGQLSNVLHIPKNTLSFLCLTRYYPHKNLEIIIEVAEKIKQQNLDIVFILTLDLEQSPNVNTLLENIRLKGLERQIINIGSVPIDEVKTLYSKVDFLLLPTLLESFSSTYVDSMALGKVIFTSDMDFAHAVCGAAAVYFDPLDPDDIYQKIVDTIFNKERLIQLQHLGYQEFDKIPKWTKISNMYLSSIRKLLK